MGLNKVPSGFFFFAFFFFSFSVFPRSNLTATALFALLTESMGVRRRGGGGEGGEGGNGRLGRGEGMDGDVLSSVGGMDGVSGMWLRAGGRGEKVYDG